MSTLTPRQVGDDLHLSVDTVVRYLRTGAIGGGFQITTPNGEWRVDEDAYRAWVAAKAAALDPHRIEPRSARSTAALTRRTS